MVAKQREIGLDVINEGEYTKGGDWLSYIEERFGGFEQRPPKGGKPVLLQGKDREEFAEFYRYASERGTLFYGAAGQIGRHAPHWVCTGADHLSRAGGARSAKSRSFAPGRARRRRRFLTTTAPASLEPYRATSSTRAKRNTCSRSPRRCASNTRRIVGAGFMLQVDDAWLPALWDRIGIAMGLEAFRKRCALRVEALNHALRNIPEERIRYHLCWGSWHGPHAYDLELIHIVDIMLRVKAQAYLIEAANARHEHEYVVWETVKLPAGKILVPGRRHPFDRRGRASRTGRAAHPAVREAGRQGERDGRRRLRLRRPHASADRLGQAQIIGGGRRAGDARAQISVAITTALWTPTARLRRAKRASSTRSWN